MKTNNFKIFLSSYLVFLLCFNVFWTVFATSSSWAVLDNFTKKQYSLLFESNLSNISDEYWDIFNLARKAEIFNNMSEKIAKDREKVEEENKKILSRITNLEESKKMIEDDISDVLNKIKDLTMASIQLKTDIELNEKKIDLMKKKVDENKKILLTYIEYVYKKSNSVYEWEKIDNLKSVILNNDDISSIINDLYYNSLMQVTWKNLMSKHMKLIQELYIQKIDLENKKVDYAKLRKQLIIEQKNLKDKLEFKERLIEVSKNQQAKYEKVIAEKLQTETKVKQIAEEQEKKASELKDKILAENNCSLVDFSNVTEKEKEDLKKSSEKCYNLNNIIYLETQLTQENTSTVNPMRWPVAPIRWISAFYRDPSYKKELWYDHNAIDIRANQGSELKAAMSGYVIYLNPPTTKDYSYLALKHPNWYTTVYWHLSEINVKLYQYVEAWEVIWKTGWEYGTNWAGFLSTWPHLHFEVFKNKQYIDPLDVLDLSYLKYTSLPSTPAKYKIKYLSDFKTRRWYDLTESEAWAKIFSIKWETEVERQKYLIEKYASPAFRDWQLWVDQSLVWWIDPSVVMCIWLAESGLGRNLTTAYNVWNVWNNDRWDRVWLSWPKEWIYAIVRTLNNKYFKNVNNLDRLSWAWRLVSGLPKCWVEACYATDPKYWHGNVTTCLSHLKWRLVEDDYNFRISK